MPNRALQNLIACQTALIRALDAGDVCAMETATSLVARALEQVRSHLVETQEDRRGLDLALRQAEAARKRVNFLTDQGKPPHDPLTLRPSQRVIRGYKTPRKQSLKRTA